MEKITAKEEIFDRIEQSFELFKDNFVKLILPIFLYTFLTATVFISIWTFFLVKYWQTFSQNFIDKDSIDTLSFLQYSPEIIIWISVWIILILLYVIFYIPFVLATIKWIKNAYNWEDIDVKKNIFYWFKSILKSFQTYWYIFAYVALIPAIIWIIWWILAIYGMSYNNDNYTTIWAITAGIALILFIFFSIYRWMKSNFALYSAIDKEQYTKDNFKNSVGITDKKWWRIFGNILLTWIIVSLVTWVIQSWIKSFDSWFSIWAWADTISELKENPEAIFKLADEILATYSPITNFILNTLQGFINSVMTVFIMIFIYILYKRLEIESSISENKVEEKIEL